MFGRVAARRRLRSAARESVQIPVFSAPVDCAPWVTGGLWPAELSAMTPVTAPLVGHLKADLQRIVDSANDELKKITRAGLGEQGRRSAEARIISTARAFAANRVASTVRLLQDAHRLNGHSFDDALATDTFTALN